LADARDSVRRHAHREARVFPRAAPHGPRDSRGGRSSPTCASLPP
jgi:hypothetical protein